MLTKTKILAELEKFPDEFSIDELVERLILIEKIETGIQQSENNQIVSEAEIDYEIKKWFK
ncbi:hypothetical protein [Maribellus sediminis]|uniref:hypothetical protein n=1 Tax=Maribellus sediminis TaxID=2696285 RepID=UPI001430EB43|nr:hypothetical protein [Maribellus sediminis]